MWGRRRVAGPRDGTCPEPFKTGSSGRRIYTRIGTAAYAIAGAANFDPTGDLPAEITLIPAARASGSEGGEQDARRAIDTDEGIAVRLLMMKGDLAAGLELLESGLADQARPLIRRPMEELFEAVHEALEERDEAVEMELEEALATAFAASEGDEVEAMKEAGRKAMVQVEETFRAVIREVGGAIPGSGSSWPVSSSSMPPTNTARPSRTAGSPTSRNTKTPTAS